MTTYVTQAPAHSGGQLAMAAPGGASGDFAPTGTGVGLLVQSAGTPGSVSLPFGLTIDGLAVQTRVVPFPATGLTLIPLPSTVYGVGTTAVVYSTVTGVTVASVQIAT